MYIGIMNKPAIVSRSPHNSAGGNSRSAILPMMKFADHRKTISEISAYRVACEISARVRSGVGVEVFFPQPQDFLQTRFVGAHARFVPRPLELLPEHRRERGVARRVERGRETVVAETTVALFGDQARVFEQAQVARDARLREAQDAGQLRDVQPVAGEDAQEAQPRLVAEQPVEP